MPRPAAPAALTLPSSHVLLATEGPKAWSNCGEADQTSILKKSDQPYEKTTDPWASSERPILLILRSRKFPHILES